MTEPGTTHVVMLVRNPYTHDSRVEKEAATLTEAGYRVTVVADAGPGLAEREERHAVAVRRIPRPGPRIPGLSYALHERRLAGVLAGLAPDLLHAHDANALLPVGVAARRTRVPFVYDAHELWLHRPRRGHAPLYHELSRAYYAVLQRWLVPRAAAVLTVSEPIVRHLARSYGRADVALVPNYPVLAARPAPAPLRGLVGDQLPATAPIVLHLGGIMASRGLEQVVAALLWVPEAHLVLLGGGDASVVAEAARRSGVVDRVHVVPPVPPSEVEAYAAAADVGVVTTQPIGLNNRYSMPNKLFQYMAAGIPVLASDFPQIRAVVEGSQAGMVTDTERPERIGACLRELLDDPSRARAMGAAGRRAVEDRFNWATSAAVLLDTYGRVVRGVAGPNGHA
jgi:glycosyltransferase involved in cell wall biosynthesis